MDLAPMSAPTITTGRVGSYADRRRAAAERLSAAANLTTQLEAALDAPEEQQRSAAPIDPDGVLRAAVRVLLPLAYRTAGFEVTVSLGPDHEWAARLSIGPSGPVAELVPGAGRAGNGARTATPSASPSAGPVVPAGACAAEIA